MDGPATDTTALPHFQSAAIVTTAELQTSQTLSPDSRALSVLFTRLEVRASNEDAAPGVARTIQVHVPIVGAGASPQASVTATVRGHVDATEGSGSACAVVAGDQVRSTDSSTGNFLIEARFIPSATQSSWSYTIMLACTRGIGLPGEATATVDSIDFAIADERNAPPP